MKPILFNTEMVWAILDRRKTHTRRVVKPQPPGTTYVQYTDGIGCGWAFWEDGDYHWVKAPYSTGDILWVRETWQRTKAGRYIYRADKEIRGGSAYYNEHCRLDGGWRPSIHMPREAARIFLRVTDVRVERLQDMTETDAEAEGYAGCPAEYIRYFPEGGAEPCFNLGDCPFQFWYCQHSLPEGFGRDIWDKTVKPADRDRYGWYANPWVWVYTFERCGKEGESWNG